MKKVVLDFPRKSQRPLPRAALSSSQMRSAPQEIEGAPSARDQECDAKTAKIGKGAKGAKGAKEEMS
jgi:hypothetical protein